MTRMPREEKLSSRLDTLLDAIFVVPSNPISLYWDIVERLHPAQMAPAQKKIRKRLQAKGEIRPESAFLVASVLHLTGFPAHRIMHFLSLYVRGGIGLSLFEFAVTTIFRGTPPLSSSLVYDITQHTYLEKRLVARKSMEISAKLKDSLSAELILYLYLLSLRDDLSNENVQLIALIMKKCVPALEVRTRVGGATLEEYGEIARAWKNAERRPLTNDLSARSRAEGRTGAGFDRDNASFFLDKYFSDAALSTLRANTPPPLPPRPRQKRHCAIRAVYERLLAVAPIVAAAAIVGIMLLSVPLSLPDRSNSGSTPVSVAPSVTAGAAPAGPAADVYSAPGAVPSTGAAAPVASGRADTATYVVREGDSLWRIFMSLKGSETAGRGWTDFLSRTTSLNALGNPDTIHPGRVLTLTPIQE